MYVCLFFIYRALKLFLQIHKLLRISRVRGNPDKFYKSASPGFVGRAPFHDSVSDFVQKLLKYKWSTGRRTQTGKSRLRLTLCYPRVSASGRPATKPHIGRDQACPQASRNALLHYHGLNDRGWSGNDKSSFSERKRVLFVLPRWKIGVDRAALEAIWARISCQSCTATT